MKCVVNENSASEGGNKLEFDLFSDTETEVANELDYELPTYTSRTIDQQPSSVINGTNKTAGKKIRSSKSSSKRNNDVFKNYQRSSSCCSSVSDSHHSKVAKRRKKQKARKRCQFDEHSLSSAESIKNWDDLFRSDEEDEEDKERESYIEDSQKSYAWKDLIVDVVKDRVDSCSFQENESLEEQDLWTAYLIENESKLHKTQQESKLKSFQVRQQERQQMAAETMKKRQKQSLLTNLRFLCPNYPLWTSSACNQLNVPKVALPAFVQRNYNLPGNPLLAPEIQQKLAYQLKVRWTHQTSIAHKWAALNKFFVNSKTSSVQRKRRELMIENIGISTFGAIDVLDSAAVTKHLKNFYANVVSEIKALVDPSKHELQETQKLVATLKPFMPFLRTTKSKRKESVENCSSIKADSSVLSQNPFIFQPSTSANDTNQIVSGAIDDASSNKENVFSTQPSSCLQPLQKKPSISGVGNTKNALTKNPASVFSTVDTRDQEIKVPGLVYIKASSTQTKLTSLFRKTIKQTKHSNCESEQTEDAYRTNAKEDVAFEEVSMGDTKDDSKYASSGFQRDLRRDSFVDSNTLHSHTQDYIDDHPQEINCVLISPDSRQSLSSVNEKSDRKEDNSKRKEDISMKREDTSNKIEDTSKKKEDISKKKEDSSKKKEDSSKKKEDSSKEEEGNPKKKEGESDFSETEIIMSEFKEIEKNILNLKKVQRNRFLDSAAYEGENTSNEENEHDDEEEDSEKLLLKGKEEDSESDEESVSDFVKLHQDLIDNDIVEVDTSVLKELHSEFMEQRDEELYKKLFTVKDPTQAESSLLAKRQKLRMNEADEEDARILREEAEIDEILATYRRKKQQRGNATGRLGDSDDEFDSNSDEITKSDCSSSQEDYGGFGSQIKNYGITGRIEKRKRRLIKRAPAGSKKKVTSSISSKAAEALRCVNFQRVHPAFSASQQLTQRKLEAVAAVPLISRVEKASEPGNACLVSLVKLKRHSIACTNSSYSQQSTGSSFLEECLKSSDCKTGYTFIRSRSRSLAE